MPDIPLPRKSNVTKARERAATALEWVLATAGSAVFVAAVTVALWLAKIEFQFVAGAFVIVFASRLAQKRLYPEVTIPEAPRPRPVRETFKGREEPLEQVTR